VHHRVGGRGDRKKEKKREPVKEERERTQSPPESQPGHPAKEREAREREGKEEEGGDGAQRSSGPGVKRRETAPGLDETKPKEPRTPDET
jgi:hypothetical protein